MEEDFIVYISIFLKAFDKINHDKLFESLQSKGVNGKFIRTLVNMYKNLHYCVKTSSGTVSVYFPCNIQEDISSPNIFSLFIDQLSTLLREKNVDQEYSLTILSHIYYV